MAKKTKARHHNFQTTTKDSSDFRTWFRGEHTHYNPTMARMVPADAVQKYVLKGWEPKEKFITEDTQITAFGSCFAANISEWLARRNYRVLNKDESAKDAYVVTCGEGMVNSFVIRQQFEWAWENKVFDEELWHGYKAESYGYDPKIQAETKRIFDETDVFILTFGLSEVWYDEVTDNVFWRTIPKDAYDPERHKFRVSTVEENKENLRAIYHLIRKHRPDAKILFTLSPIPLIATFRDNSCLTSNSVSKSILRVAIDEVVREFSDEGILHYWPSFEIVTDVFKMPYRPDRRHPQGAPLSFIMTLFEHTWCADGDIPKPSVLNAWAQAGAQAELFPPAMCRCILAKRWGQLERIVEKGELDSDPKLNAAYLKLAEELIAANKAAA